MSKNLKNSNTKQRTFCRRVANELSGEKFQQVETFTMGKYHG